MTRLNRDTIVAIVLLLFCGAMFWAAGQIRDPGYGQMGSDVWPRMVLGFLTVLVLIYLVQSWRAGIADAGGGDARRRGGLRGWLEYYQNPIWCYLLFLGFLLTLPYLGMLVGGVLFAFLMMTVLGGRAPRQLALHALIALICVGAMWSIFTFGLRVILPQGELFKMM